MEINDLKIFYEVAKLGSISKAAEKLEYVQSNVSKRILKVEDEIKRTLFIRENNGVKLTKDGEKFLKKVEVVLSDFSIMERTFLEDNQQISIGATNSISYSYLQQSILNEEITVFTKPISELIRMLKSGSIYVLVVNKKIEDIEIKEVSKISETVCWVKSNQNKSKFIENKIIISRDRECPYRLEVLKYLKENSLEDMAIIEVDTMALLVSMIESGTAITVLPKKIIDMNPKLEAIDGMDVRPVDIYVYTLMSNQQSFRLTINDLTKKQP